MEKILFPRRWRNCSLAAVPIFALIVLYLVGLSGQQGRADSRVEITEGNNGLASLTYAGANLLGNGDITLQQIKLRSWDGNISDGKFDVTNTAVTPGKVTKTYPWGIVSCAYKTLDNRLNMEVEVKNTSPSIIDAVSLQLMELKFPQAPTGWIPNYIYMGHNVGTPTINLAQYGAGTLAACNDDLGRPLYFGFPGRQSLTQRPLYVSTKTPENSALLDPILSRPIYPGNSDTYHLSLRFGNPDAKPETLAGDLLSSFAKTYPATLKWSDKRPIGTIHLSTSEKDHHSATNPRGWFGDPKDVDVTTEAGRAKLRERLMKYADDSIAVLKGMNAQGIVVWDIEGQEYPHATSYLGDPRSLPAEMEPIADEFFAKFKAAGLRTGVCLRPQIPVRAAYGEGVQQIEVADAFQVLNDKIAYAKKRWGATLFYIDSNGDPNVPFDVTLFQRLAAAHPDVLLMPEHENTRYYAYTAPYNELRGGVTGTPTTVRAAYPQAFGVIYVPDGDVAANRAALVASVKQGDILMFRGWFDDAVNADIKSIYQDAGR